MITGNRPREQTWIADKHNLIRSSFNSGELFSTQSYHSNKQSIKHHVWVISLVPASALCLSIKPQYEYDNTTLKYYDENNATTM
jgi:hypothetical protein